MLRLPRFACFLSIALVSCARSAPVTPPPPDPLATSEPAKIAARGVIDGVVTTHGEPLEGALVAVVPLDSDGSSAETSTRAAAKTVSDARGAFHFEGVPPGDYALTATSQRAPAAFASGIHVTVDQPVRGVALAMADVGYSLSGVARDRAGAVVANEEVRAVRYGKESGDVFFTTTDASGRYSMKLPQAQYGVCAMRPGGDLDMATTTVDHDQSFDLTVEDPAIKAPPPDEVVAWMKANALRISHADAGHGFDDLAGVEKLVGDARVVSLGEATHGTREFFQLKHRMLELLATRKGFDVFAIEATMPEGFDVNEYVLTGKGDPEKALSALYFWTWNTEEVLEMIRWMRSYNADPKHSKKLKFYGFDMQMSTRAAKVVRAYLQRVDPELEGKEHAILTALGTPRRQGDKAPDPKEAMGSAVAILSAFDGKRGAWEKKSSAKEWQLARQHAVILRQCADNEARPSDGVRDLAMADNVRWILEQEGPKSKIVLWSHNLHAQITSAFGHTSMGESLHKTLGAQMVTMGFAFGKGSFQAMELPFATGRGLMEFTVPSQAPGGLGASLALAGAPIAAFDLRALPAGVVRDWFGARHLTREVGSGFDPKSTEARDWLLRATDRFDALVFVADTTSARPVGGRPNLDAPGSPKNLDFEAPGKGLPGDWMGEGAATWGYTAEVVDGGAAQGKRSLSLRRAPGRHYGEGDGWVRQRVDARPFAGKRVTISASLRFTRKSEDATAYLRMQSTSPRGAPASVKITSKEWTKSSVSIDLPKDATIVTYGVELSGDGELDADAFTIETRTD